MAVIIEIIIRMSVILARVVSEGLYKLVPRDLGCTVAGIGPTGHLAISSGYLSVHNP